MTNNTNHSANTGTITDYESRGFEDAKAVDGSYVGLLSRLNSILHLKETEAKQKSEQQVKLIESLQKQITAIDESNQKIRTHLAENEKEIGNLQTGIGSVKEDAEKEIFDNLNKIKELQKEVDDLIEKLKNPDSQPPENIVNKFWYRTVLTVFFTLTVFLFIFYSSNIYSALLRNINTGSPSGGEPASSFDKPTTSYNPISVVNFDAFSLILSESDPTKKLVEILFLICAPSLLLGASISAFYFWKDAKEDRDKYKGYLVYILTLLFDLALVHHVVTVRNDILNITTMQAVGDWGFFSPFSNPLFWILISFGFAGYVIWGLCFKQIIDAQNVSAPGKKKILDLQRAIDLFQRRMFKIEADKNYSIDKGKNEIEALKQKNINNLREIQENERRKTEIQNQINSVDSKISLNRYELKRDAQDYVFGWLKHLNQNGHDPATKEKYTKDYEKALFDFLHEVNKSPDHFRAGDNHTN